MTAVSDFRRALSGVGRLAETEASKLWRALPLDNPAAVAAALAEALPVTVHRLGDVAATSAADFYAQLRDTSGVSRLPTFTPRLADRLPDEQVASSARWAAAPLFALEGPTQQQAYSRLLEVTDRLSKQPGRDTVVLNVRADPAKPRWARVPTGTWTCDFCLMLASRGAVYRSEEVASGYHAHCDCVPTPVWGHEDYERLLEQGYDPEQLYEEYLVRQRDGTRVPRPPRARQAATVLPAADVPSVPPVVAHRRDWLTAKPRVQNLEDHVTVTEDLAKLAPAVREEFEDTLKRLGGDYPAVFDELGMVGTAADVYRLAGRRSVPAGVSGVSVDLMKSRRSKNAIGLSTVNRTSPARLPKVIAEAKDMIDQGWWAKVPLEHAVARYTTTHEFGHLIRFHIARNPDLAEKFRDRVNDILEAEGQPRMFVWRISQLPGNEAIRARKREAEAVSKYAAQNDDELFGEAFAAWKLSDDPPLMARAIGQAVDELLKVGD